MYFRSKSWGMIYLTISCQLLCYFLEKRVTEPTYVFVDASGHVDFIIFRTEMRMRPEMTSDDELRQHFILYWVNGVFHHAEHVETRQDRFGELDILLERYSRVVSPSNRIGSGDNGASSLQCSDDTSF